MSKEDRDLGAGYEEFMAVFRVADKSLKRELDSLFINSFTHSYYPLKKEILKDLKDYPRGTFIWTHSRSSLLRIVRDIQGLKGMTVKDRADALGRILGAFLSVVEWGIAAYEFGMRLEEDDKDAYVGILELTGEIARGLKEINISVKPKFIGNRVKRIAREKAGQLSNRQQEIISRIAAQFM